MKSPFFKSLVAIGTLTLIWSCSEEEITKAINSPTSTTAFAVETNSWWIHGDADYLITPTPAGMAVTDAYRNPVGMYDQATQTIYDTAGNVIIAGVDIMTAPIINPDATVTFPDGTITDLSGNTIYTPQAVIPTTDPIITNPMSSASAFPTATSSTSTPNINSGIKSSASTPTAVSSSSATRSSASAPIASSSSIGKKTTGNITYTDNLKQTIAQASKSTAIVFSGLNSKPNRQSWNLYFISDADLKYDENAKTFTIASVTIPEGFQMGETSDTFQFDGTQLTITFNVTAKGSNPQQQQQQHQSSSSKTDQPKSSAGGQQQQQQQSGADPSYKVKNGGKSGNGWGSRYWDCCMPHCAWSGNTGNPTKTCNAQMQSIGESGGSVCNNGQGGVCDTQAPWAVNDKFAFAFAAVPAGAGGDCGKCYLLTFDGGSHNGGAQANTGALSGKKMIIMVSNIGGDVQSNQFDIMIPGGGVGQFNGCGTQLGIPSTGPQYGGYITECESDPNCVKNKCSAFSKYPKLQAGCEFSATWMNAANNPTFKFEELESCPSEIASKW